MKRQAILVTGALGHIGSALIRSFDPSQVEEIILLDNLESQRYPTLFDLPSGSKYRFIQADIRSVDWTSILHEVDIVIHLAALTNAENSLDKNEEFNSINFEAVKQLADACLQQKKKLIFPSTTSVYGSQADQVDETCTELQPQSPYADSKLKSEQYLQALASKGLQVSLCRFGTIFGWSVGMRFHTAVNKFIWQAVSGQPITVWKTAWQQRRPYLALSDCLKAIHFILDHDMFDGEIYNVVSHNFTVEQVVEAIKKIIPTTEIIFVESRIMNQLSYDVRAEKFASKGFLPHGQLDQGVEETIKHLQALYS